MCLHFFHAAYACGCLQELSPCKLGYRSPVLCRAAKMACRNYHKQSNHIGLFRCPPIPKLCPPVPASENGPGNIGLVILDFKCPAHFGLEDLNEISAKHRTANYIYILGLNMDMAGRIFPVTKWRAATGDNSFIGEYEGEDGSFVGVESYTVGSPSPTAGFAQNIWSNKSQSDLTMDNQALSSGGTSGYGSASQSFLSSTTATSPSLHKDATRATPTPNREHLNQSKQHPRPCRKWGFIRSRDHDSTQNSFIYRSELEHMNSSALPTTDQSSTQDPPQETCIGKDTSGTATYYVPHTPSRSQIIPRRRRTSSI